MEENSDITCIFRKKLPQFNSIEAVFESVLPEFQKQRQVEVQNLPYCGGLVAAIKNLVLFKKKKNTLYHITGHDNYIALRTGRNTILTIHDIGSALQGGAFRKLIIKVFWFWLPALIVRKITVISNFSKNEVEQLIPFAKQKICVIHNPVAPQLHFFEFRFNHQKPTLLFLGTKQNKNLERTVEALRGIKCLLVIIGKLSAKQKLLLLENSISYQNEYHLPYNQIIEWYRKCDMLLFPSLYEGFGLPILEAQATGRPVVTSNLASMPEVAGEGACLVDPYSVGSIRNGIRKIADDTEFRKNLVEKGLLNVRRFHFEKIALQYQTVYRTFDGE